MQSTEVSGGLLVLIEQGQRVVVDLFVVLTTLFLHIVLQHGQIAVLTHCVGVVLHRPEAASPQEPLHLWMLLEQAFGGDAPDELYQVGNRPLWNCLEEKVCMVAVYSYLQEADLVPEPQFHTGLFQDLFIRFGEDVPAELHRAD